MRPILFANSLTPVRRVLILVLLQTLLMSIISTANGQALQVYSRRQTSKPTRMLRARDTYASSLEPSRTFPHYECAPKEVDPKTWKELELDSYLKTYPNGLTLTLTQFAQDHGALNLLCGMNQFCSAGQLCSPVIGRAWWVLAAVEQYTLYQNSLYTAIGFAADQAKGKYPQNAKKKFRLFQSIGMILTLTMACVAVLAGVVFLVTPGLQAFAVAATAGAAVAIAQVTVLMKARAAELEAGRQDTFTKWAGYENQIANWRENAQTELQKRFEEVLNSPIGTHRGILGALEGGSYLQKELVVDMNDIKQKLSKVLTIRMIGQILRAKKGFVTLTHDCSHGGPNGAYPIDSGWLSYCYLNGTMLNVIYDNDGKSGNQFYNARVLVEKYNVTTEYIVKQAFGCWKRRQGPDFDPYADGTSLPHDEHAPCLINLPFCDTTISEVHKKLKHHTTPKACRVTGQISLP
ncbi:hypothetical protein PCASD_09734 [Puccinia coronata f. sp. avenae]|uniref:DUF7872 domain-containing protein n=1 Tax=Puccinia coronata f. sp. avenae TaxID=200324 RepID=A0A2N5U4A2_9BASI|nr:hypothetical protein PCASD_09734 [Puccinia coronata f. sp. avenae]